MTLNAFTILDLFQRGHAISFLGRKDAIVLKSDDVHNL